MLCRHDQKVRIADFARFDPVKVPKNQGSYSPALAWGRKLSNEFFSASVISTRNSRSSTLLFKSLSQQAASSQR